MSLLTGDELGLVKCVNLKSKTLSSTCGSPHRPDAVSALCLVPTEATLGRATSASRVAVVSREGVLKVWDTVSGRCVHVCVSVVRDAIFLAAWKGNFVVASRSGAVSVFSQGAVTCEGAGSRVFNVGPNVCAVAFHDVAGVLAVGGREHEPELWDVEGGTRVWAARAVAPDALDLRVPVWNTAIVFIPEAVSAEAKEDAAAAGGKSAVQPRPLSCHRFVVSTGTRSLRFYDSRLSQRPLQSVNNVGDFPFTALALSGDARFIVTGDSAGIMREFNARSLELCGVFRGHTGAIRGFAVHDSLPYIASISLDRTARVYHMESRQLLRRFYLKQRLFAVVFAPTGGKRALPIKSADGALPGSGKGLRMEAAAAILTREVEADNDSGEGEGGTNEGDEDDDDEQVWEELQRREQEAAKSAKRSKRA